MTHIEAMINILILEVQKLQETPSDSQHAANLGQALEYLYGAEYFLATTEDLVTV